MLGLGGPPVSSSILGRWRLSSRLTFLVTWCRRGLQPKGCASSPSSNAPALSNVISMGSRSTGQYSDHQSLLLLARRQPTFLLSPTSLLAAGKPRFYAPLIRVALHPLEQGRSAATKLHSRHGAAAYRARERFIARRRRAKASAASFQGTARPKVKRQQASAFGSDCQRSLGEPALPPVPGPTAQGEQGRRPNDTGEDCPRRATRIGRRQWQRPQV